MSNPSGMQENIDYEPTMNVARAHAAVAREKEDQPVKHTPLTLPMIAGIIGIAIAGGAYIGSNAGPHYNLHGANYQPEQPPGASAAVELPENVKWLKEGAKVYEAVCAGCHQPNGLGVPGQFPPLDGSEFVTHGEERLATIVLKGLVGPITVKGAGFGAVPMSPKGGQALTPKAVAQVLSYIRNSWSNKGSFIMDDQIKELEARIADISSPMPTAHLEQIAADKNLPPSKKPIAP
jgi:mono/diheme cytochrome c family protein